MKAGKMTNEELAHNLHATIPFLTKEARHVTDADEIMREAATRLLNQGEIAAKDAEIKNLRSALKPVLELEDIYDGHWPFASLAADAVKESQRIYKEGEENQNEGGAK